MPGPIVSARWLAAGAAILLLILIGAVITGIVLRDDHRTRTNSGSAGAGLVHTTTPSSSAHGVPVPTPATASAGSTRASVTQSASASVAGGLPAGWHFYHDSTGFSVAVPDGWSQSTSNGMRYFREPGGGRVLGIDQTKAPKSDPVADWRSQEQSRVSGGDFPGYHEIKIVSVNYHLAAADWEFTYNDNGVSTHVINRGAVFGKHQAYGIYWATPDAEWSANLANFDLITSTFQGLTG
jgi:hypothetical protein